jgi:hypothetical protein
MPWRISYRQKAACQLPLDGGDNAAAEGPRWLPRWGGVAADKEGKLLKIAARQGMHRQWRLMNGIL